MGRLLWTSTNRNKTSNALSSARFKTKIGKKIESGSCTIVDVSENGDITLDLDEDFPTLMKGYKITAKRKRLRKLKQIAAFTVAKYISGNSDIMNLQIPQSLYRLVSNIP